MSDELKKYKEAIALLAKENRNMVFPNDGNDHAHIVFEQIFNSAQNTVSIAAGSLCNEFTEHNGYLEAVEQFTNRPNSQLHILINDYDESRVRQSAFFQRLRGKENVLIRESNARFCSQDIPEIHFCVGDNRMYRLEYDIAGRRAMCNFNDTERAATLIGVFSQVFEGANIVSNPS